MTPDSGSDEECPRLPMPSRNPLPLSSSQEIQVRELYHTRVRGYCAAEIKAFADCALGRTFTAPFKCRNENQEMNQCMLKHATVEEQDAAREEWFAQRLQRQMDREAKELRRLEQEKFHREWWGLPPIERDSEKGREIIRKAERIGGFPRPDDGHLSKDRHR